MIRLYIAKNSETNKTAFITLDLDAEEIKNAEPEKLKNAAIESFKRAGFKDELNYYYTDITKEQHKQLKTSDDYNKVIKKMEANGQIEIWPLCS